jgi:hypothetical protein
MMNGTFEGFITVRTPTCAVPWPWTVVGGTPRTPSRYGPNGPMSTSTCTPLAAAGTVVDVGVEQFVRIGMLPTLVVPSVPTK